MNGSGGRAERSLTIVIPALNEEEAIAATIERCKVARTALLETGDLSRVSIVVVSDGSTDRTASIARCVPDVAVVEFEHNRGYGAAIKAGWEQAPADLLAFIDADGTCDPMHFVPLCAALDRDGLDMVLGNRMGASSRMPLIRRLGNTIFATLLGHLSGRQVEDTASGMRVLRRSALPDLLPLPDGLHFTPAMSARALVDGRVKVGEVPMPYEERIGRSKLAVVRDGFRFLYVILAATAYVRLSRLTLPVIVAVGAVAAALLVGPAHFYATRAQLEEWMLYRIALALALSTIALTLLCFTIVAEHVSALARLRYHTFAPETRGVWRYETLRRLMIAAAVAGGGAIAINAGGILEFLRSGHITTHWSRIILGAFLLVDFVLLGSTVTLLRIVRGLHGRQPFIDSVARDGPAPK